MALSPEKMGVTAKNAGAVWCAMAAFDLQDDPRYAELERKLGVNAAKTIAITSAGNFWNADLAFSNDKLHDSNVPLDESRASAVRLGVYQAVESVAGNRGIGSDVIGRIADSFYARLSNYQRASLGGNPASSPVQADMSASIEKEITSLTGKAPGSNAVTTDSENKVIALGLASIRMGDAMQDRNSSGSRYDQMPSSATTSGTSYYGTPAGMSEMRQLAMSQGVAWVANDPQLLRLGPEVIKAIAKTGMEQSNYKHLTDAGFKPKDVGTIAQGVETYDRPKEENRKLYDNLGTAFKGDAPEDQQRRDKVTGLFRDSHDHPENKDKNLARLNELATETEKAHPNDAGVRKSVHEIKDWSKKAAEASAEKTVQADATSRRTVQAADAKQNVSNIMGDLDEPKEPTKTVQVPNVRKNDFKPMN